MGLYKHEVFFQARELTDSEKEKIQKYFQIRRKSGGGECGPVEKVDNGTYTISFLEQEGKNLHYIPKYIALLLSRKDICKTNSQIEHYMLDCV